MYLNPWTQCPARQWRTQMKQESPGLLWAHNAVRETRNTHATCHALCKQHSKVPGCSEVGGIGRAGLVLGRWVGFGQVGYWTMFWWNTRACYIFEVVRRCVCQEGHLPPGGPSEIRWKVLKQRSHGILYPDGIGRYTVASCPIIANGFLLLLQVPSYQEWPESRNQVFI